MLKPIAFVEAMVAVFPCLASPQVEALSRCVAGSISGKARKGMARWLFVAMAAHPEMRSMSSVGPAAPEDTSRLAAGGSLPIQSAFQTLGQLAMQGARDHG